MKDRVKEDKYNNMNNELFLYKKYMCNGCYFYRFEKCVKNRIARVCAKKGLRNRN